MQNEFDPIKYVKSRLDELNKITEYYNNEKITVTFIGFVGNNKGYIYGIGPLGILFNVSDEMIKDAKTPEEVDEKILNCAIEQLLLIKNKLRK